MRKKNGQTDIGVARWAFQENFHPLQEVTNLRRCLAIVERSTVTLEEGRRTGSSIRVDMIGSKNSSGASEYVSSSCCCLSAWD